MRHVARWIVVGMITAAVTAPVRAGDPLSMGDARLDFLAMLANIKFASQSLVAMIAALGRPAGNARGQAEASEGTLLPVAGTMPEHCPASKGGVVHPNGRFIYMATDTGAFGNVCAFAFDDAMRALTAIPGSPFRAGVGTRAVTSDPSGAYVYAADFSSNTVSAFVVDPRTGTLTPVPGSPFPAGVGPIAIVADPTGRFLYSVNTGVNARTASSISAYRIDRATGTLAPVAGSPFGTDLTNPGAATMDPRGRFLYVGDSPNQAYAVDPVTGALAKLGAWGGNLVARGLAIDPSGRFLYATSADASGWVTPFRLGSDGRPVAAAASAMTGSNPSGVVVSRTGRHVYTANDLSGDISGFRIDDATGGLAPLAGSPFPAAENIRALAVAGTLAPSMQWPAGEALHRPLGVQGGTPPYSFSIVAGAVPSGMQLLEFGVLSGTPAAPGAFAFTAQVTDATGATASRAYTFEVVGGVTLPVMATVVEYYNAALDHYFITWLADEIAKLDAGVSLKGWTRTGKGFDTWISAQAGASPICRYYIPPGKGDSHFFGRGSVECAATGTANPSFVLEDPAFMYLVLPVGGTCATGSKPVYRVFSQRPDANHRYTTDRAVRDAMVGQGWLAEGDGPDLVVMCAP